MVVLLQVPFENFIQMIMDQKNPSINDNKLHHKRYHS